ncbi:MAG: hypothetical protein ABMA15_07535 [Vicinamibacterales bacterium]
MRGPITAATMTAVSLFAVTAMAQAVDARVAEALKPLPEDLKAGATVVAYDAASGARQVLRQGTNQIECQPKADDGFVRCYNKILAPRRDLEAKLRAQKKSDADVAAAVAEGQKAGTIPRPQFGTMSYRYSDDPKRIKLLWVMSVPNATPESLGVSTTSQRDAALKGAGQPWMMLPGTPGAHIMIPINALPLSNTAAGK